VNTTTANIARAMHDQGWSPLPLPAGKKYPPPDGYTGYAGRNPTTADIDRWDWTGNIALRLPPDVIGIDVDVYKGGNVSELENLYGELPPTIWSTSRTDGSGISLFRVPPGTTINANPANAIEAIQAHHRYMVVWPSIHPDGGQYEWLDETSGETLDHAPDIDDLPDMPWAWIEGLAVAKGETATAAAPADVRAFIDRNTTGTAPGRLRGVQSRLDNYQGSRHDTLVEVACWALREAEAGCYTAQAAIDVLDAWWHRVMDDPNRLDGSEFGAAIRWATAQATLDPARIEQIKAETKTTAPAQVPTPPPNIDPDTGEILQPHNTRNLPDAFWEARPELHHIRQAAHSRLTSADAVLICTLARITTLIPPSNVLPAIIGGEVSANLFGSIVDPSGGGKSAAMSVARRLVPIIRKDIIDPILPSSGEGLIEAFMGWVEEEGDDGKKRKERKQVMNAGFAWVDEGQGLLAQADRSGSTIMETIRSAWMGQDLGQHNASEDRKRWLKEHRYRLSMVIGFQLAYAAHLIGDSEGGTPQRFTFALGTDPNIDDNVTWPGTLDLERWPSYGTLLTDITVDQDVQDGIRDRRRARSRGELTVDPLDVHQDLRRLKLGVAIGALNGRLEINAEDWELACEIDDTSCSVRSLAVEVDRTRKTHERQTGMRLAIERDEAVEAAVIRRAIEGGCRSISRRVWRGSNEGKPWTLNAAWRLVKSSHRDNADREAALALAVDRGWLVDIDDELHRGKVDPR
jgi:hypothetical protein